MKILSHIILWYFYPNLHCSFQPQVLNSDMAISILPYIALFTYAYVKYPTLWKFNLTFWYLYPYLHCSFCLIRKHSYENDNSIPLYVVSFLSLLALQFLASCLKHWYENIYPTLHCTFAYVLVLTLSAILSHLTLWYFYPYLHCRFQPHM